MKHSLQLAAITTLALIAGFVWSSQADNSSWSIEKAKEYALEGQQENIDTTNFNKADSEHSAALNLLNDKAMIKADLGRASTPLGMIEVFNDGWYFRNPISEQDPEGYHDFYYSQEGVLKLVGINSATAKDRFYSGPSTQSQDK